MQARTRRNRVAILLSMILCFTSTCAMQDNRDAMQRSGSANVAYAFGTISGKNETDEHAVSDNAVSEEGTGKVADWWKADLNQYDNSLSLVSYEAENQGPDEPLTTTTALTTNTIISGEINNKNTGDSVHTEKPATTTITEPAITTPQSVNAAPGSVVFYTSGHGHGVGMSQYGANFYAIYDGWTYDQILSLYYPGTQLVQTGTQEWNKMTVGGKTDTVVSILSQIVYNEMGDTFSPEAYKAQAVAAYSFYLYNGYGAGMICKSNPPQSIVDAVRSVCGIALYYNGAPALTSFYASSSGTTASCKDIFSSDVPYLRSITVQHDESSDPNYHSAKVFTASELKSKLERKYNITLTGNPCDWIKLEYGDGGYVAYAVIGGQVRVRGNDLRGVLNLKSPKFEFEYIEDIANVNPSVSSSVSTSTITSNATSGPMPAVSSDITVSSESASSSSELATQTEMSNETTESQMD